MPLDLDAATAARLVRHAADITLTIDDEGRVETIEIGTEDLAAARDAGWVGCPWADSLVEDSRPRLEELREAARRQPGNPQRRDLVHRLPDGSELPVQYTVLASASGEMTAIGRDLRPLQMLRQQLLNAQQALEADYWRLRQVETRYRLLFQMAGEAMLMVDEASGRILEANSLAAERLNPGGQGIVGKHFPLGFDAEGLEGAREALAETRAVGKGQAANLRSADGANRFALSAQLLRQDGESRILVRLGGGNASGSGESQRLSETLRRAPDAIAVTDEDGRILHLNRSFLDLAELVSEEQALGQPLDRWLGRSSVDLNVLMTSLRQRDLVRLFSTSLRSELGALSDVEVSACRFGGIESPAFAFFVRDIGRRVSAEHPMNARLPRSIEQLTQRVGRVPLKELVRESTDIIEALCIEAALDLTEDNRASAAELLGLSRQSLYAKLRRYRLGGLGEPE